MNRTHVAAPLEGANLAAATDAQVVAQVLTGHADAARELVRRYQRPVYNLIARMVQDPATAEDLAQDTFAKVFRALHSFDARLRFAAWILRVAHNTTLDYLRRHRPHLVPLDAPSPPDERPLADRLPDTVSVSPERAAARQQLTAALDAALDRLRPEYRRVVILRYQEDLDYAEIAEVVGLPLGTVKTFLHRARHVLADDLRRSGWAPASPPETSRRAGT